MKQWLDDICGRGLASFSTSVHVGKIESPACFRGCGGLLCFLSTLGRLRILGYSGDNRLCFVSQKEWVYSS